MLIKQLVVEATNQPGELYKIVRTLSDNNIDIKALISNAETESGVVIAKVKLIVLNNEMAVSALQAEGFKAYLEDVVIVDVSDTPGAFTPILSAIRKSETNIEYVYTFLSHVENKALAVFRFDNMEKGLQVLKDSHFTIVTDNTIKSRYGNAPYFEERDIAEYLSTIITP